MLLDEDPATLLRHTIGNFNILPDKLAVARINETYSSLQEAREVQVSEAETALRKLSRTLTTLTNNHNETIAAHSASAHASEVATLDTQKFRIAKAASDLEIETERLSSQLADLQAKLQELELRGVDGGDQGVNGKRLLIQDEVLLKLKVYRSLGMEIERDDESGEYNKAVITSEKKGDIHVVNMDGKFSKFFYANYFWKML